ncbi:MAG: hypothetical protein HGB04_03210 [Chlorobiaceae bacterium]|nr:hypothetical protein [Chlorobiaceae bacterium]
MWFRAIKYGEFFKGQIIACRQQKRLHIKFIRPAMTKNKEWCVLLEPSSAMNPGIILELDGGVLCEIVSKKGANHHIQFLKTGMHRFDAWLEIKIGAS